MPATGVVVLHREYQRGKGSGVELVIDTATIVDVRDGRIVRMQGYMNPADTFEAVGLSEQGRSRRLLSLSDTARAMSQEDIDVMRRVGRNVEPHGP
jgi:hypothetical protein